MADNILETQRFSWNFVLQRFWGHWLRIRHWVSIFQNGASNMANVKFLKLCDFRTTLYSGVLGSLITNFKLDFQNSADFELILMRYSVCSPLHLIFSHVALSNRYYKFFCSNFILAIPGSIVYYESIHNFLITSFPRSASEPELSEPESWFSAVTFPSKLFSDARMHGFLKSIPKIVRKHGFRWEISLFQSWEWGLNISKKIVVLGRWWVNELKKNFNIFNPFFVGIQFLQIFRLPLQ